MISSSRPERRSRESSSAPAASTGARFVAWLVDIAIVAGLFSGLWLFGLIRISGCEGFDSATNAFPPGCPFESTREVDGEIVYVLDSGRELPADHPTIEPPLLGIRVVDPPGASAYLVTLVYVLVVFVAAQGAAGATPGKWLAGIRLSDDDGEPLGLSRAGVRWLLPDGAIALVGLLAVLAGGPWVLRLLAANGVLRIGNSLAGLLSGTGRGPGDRAAGSMVTTASAFALGFDDEPEAPDHAPAGPGAPGQGPVGASWPTAAWKPSPDGPPTAEQPVVPAPGSTPATEGPPPASVAPSTPWAMPPMRPEAQPLTGPPRATSSGSEADAPGPGAGQASDDSPGLRFPWLPEPGAEVDQADQGWVPATMEPPVEGAAPIDEPPVPMPEEIVGSASTEPSPADPEVERADASALLPGSPPLPAVAPSAMPSTNDVEPADAAHAAGPPAGTEPSAAETSATAEPTTTPPEGAQRAVRSDQTRAGEQAGAGEQAAASEQAGGAGTGRADWPAGQPVWDEARGAYIFWDPAKGEWLQFDYASGAWGPISRAG